LKAGFRLSSLALSVLRPETVPNLTPDLNFKVSAELLVNPT
jgi:hypothetical protein